MSDLTPQDEADLAELNAPDALVIESRVPTAVLDADEPLGIVMGIVGAAFDKLIREHGGDIRTLRFEMNEGIRESDGEKIVSIVTVADRRADWDPEV
jgi:hypothetical protein